MGQYENGAETANKILAACRKLFYEKGYTQTTFQDIRKEANVNLSAIHYHFKSKENLLEIIHTEGINKNNAEAEKYYDSSTLPSTKYLFAGHIYNYKVFHDAKYRRFLDDSRILMNGKSFDEYIRTTAGAFFPQKNGYIVLTEKKMHEIMAMIGYGHMGVIYLDNNISQCTLESFNRISTEIYCRLLQIDEVEYKLILQQLETLCSRCKWDEIDTTLDL